MAARLADLKGGIEVEDPRVFHFRPLRPGHGKEETKEKTS